MVRLRARLYDPALGRFHALDPHAENYLSWTPYNYVANNPILLIDPNGMDWFYNDQTGNVIYVSSLRQGAEKGMEEGWQWMGVNNMFSNGKSGTDDASVLEKNKDLADDFSTNEFYDSDGNMSLTTSASFTSDNAKTFMKGQGYDFKPKTYKFHNDVTTEYYPEPHGQVTISHDNSNVEQVLTSRYIHQDLVVKNTKTLSDYKPPIYGPPKLFGPMYSIRDQSWTIRKDIYGTHAFGRKAGKAINWLEKNTPWKSAYEKFLKK